jgi:hypothetical protein
MTIILAVALVLIAALTLLGAGGTPMLIGVQRKPLTESQAGGRILLGIFYAAVFIWAAVVLFRT